MDEAGLKGTAVAAMDAQAIMGMLRHRFPFLLVDRVLSCIPGESIIGFKNVTIEECPPNRGNRGRSMPAYLVLEALAQISVILTFRSLGIEPKGDELMFFAGIDRAAIRGFAAPGDSIALRAEVIRIMPSKGIAKFGTRAETAGGLLVQAEMMAAMRAGVARP